MRRKEMTGGFAATYLVLSLVVVALTLLPKTHGHRLDLAATMAPFLLASLLMAWRYHRSGLLVSSDGVQVRGLIRDRELSLREVQSFDVGIIGSPGMLQAAYGILMRRESGRPVLLRSLSKFGWNKTEAREKAKEEWRPTADALNELLANLKGSPIPEPMPPRPSRSDALRLTLAYAFSSAMAFAFLVAASIVSRHGTILLIIALAYLPIAIGSTVYIGRHAYAQVRSEVS